MSSFPRAGTLRAENVDLHSHSSVSDGTLLPKEVAACAHDNGVTLWALTDHDEVSGVAQARQAAAELGMGFVAGVEISVTWAGKTIHVVGLGIDENEPRLVQGLAHNRTGRERRARAIGQALAHVAPDAYQGAVRHAGNADLISRTHFARFLVEQGVCSNLQDVFDRFLVQGKPGYVEHQWATLAEALGWIQGAGGAAVLAHPGRYSYDDLAFSALMDAFKALGGAGIEVVTGSHTVDQYEQYARLARRYGLLASRGSDFHSPGESRVAPGTLPPLPPQLKPVWSLWG